jgi:hypothetical protein
MEFPRHHIWWPLIPAPTRVYLSVPIVLTLLHDFQTVLPPAPPLASP